MKKLLPRGTFKQRLAQDVYSGLTTALARIDMLGELELESIDAWILESQSEARYDDEKATIGALLAFFRVAKKHTLLDAPPLESTLYEDYKRDV